MSLVIDTDTNGIGRYYASHFFQQVRDVAAAIDCNAVWKPGLPPGPWGSRLSYFEVRWEGQLCWHRHR